MELHTCLWNDIPAFDFSSADIEALRKLTPDLKIKQHTTAESFLSEAATADLLLTWYFMADWYPSCPNLKMILTPAAGSEWVEQDPSGVVPLIHGTFHGEVMSESLLSAILFMNHRMPSMVDNFINKGWQRTSQTQSRLLSNQQVLIIGYGSIAEGCANLISATGAEVIGVNRKGAPNTKANPQVKVYPVNQLDELLPQADHVVLLLPANNDTNALMNTERLLKCKPGAYLYNFGRGNALTDEHLLAAWHHLGGAFLDVTEIEPLPVDSPLWELDNIMITPHSSCIYQDYKSLFIQQAGERIMRL
jgi:D-2-hydroxyacid dehydrogenase (NADP+)